MRIPLKFSALSLLAIGLAQLAIADDNTSNVITLQYSGFTVFHDCETGLARGAFYEAVADAGDIDRDHHFHLDPNLPDHCKQQTSTKTYRSPKGELKYDRGHLVPANHLDHSQEAISASNVMTNITPQQSSFNRTGAWRETEKRIECWRDRESLQVWIGVIAGDDASNDFVKASHGIITPDYFIKLVIKGDEAIAWELPNQKIRAKQLDDYSVSPILAATKIEHLTGANITDQLPQSSDPQNWPRLSCDQS